MTKEKKAVTFETFYAKQEEAEAAIPEVFSSPAPLKPFTDGVEWVNVEFPTSFGTLMLETPRLKDSALVTPDLEAATAMFGQNDC